MVDGPGGREVGRVSLRVLPDTSKFLPSLKKYVERVERTVAVRLSTTIDSRGLEADAARISQQVESTVPTIRIPATPVSDGFARDLQAQVKAASAAIEANIPLTADGERLRRDVLAEIATLEAEIRQLDLEVPLDVEEAARARLQLRERVAALQAFANLHAVQIPVEIGSPSLGTGSFLGLSPATLASLSGVAAVLAGSAIASLPAIIASIAAPVAAIAIGFQGIATAASVAAPAFEIMRQALSNTFAQQLVPVFAKLAEILPQITPQFEAIAVALSGAFAEVATALSSPEGIAALQEILQGVADAITILAPSLGPLTEAFLAMAQSGMKAFVDAAPALNDALTTMANVFTYLNDTGVIALAAQAFTLFVTAAVVASAAIGAILVVLAAAEGQVNEWRAAIGTAITRVIGFFNQLGPGVLGAMSTVVRLVSALPQRVLAALSGLGGILFSAGAQLIQGLINGILSMFGPLGQAVGGIASLIAGFFPGSPVKEGPLTSWNGGGAGKRLGEMLADGLEASSATVRAASTTLASSVAVPTAQLVGASVAARPSAAVQQFERQTMADDIADALRKTRLEVGVGNVTQAVNHKNAQRARG